MKRLTIPLPVQAGSAAWPFDAPDGRPLLLLIDKKSLRPGLSDDLVLRFAEHPSLEIEELPDDWMSAFRDRTAESLRLRWNSPWKGVFRKAEITGATRPGMANWPGLYCSAWASVRCVDIVVTRRAGLLARSADFPVNTVNPMTPRMALGYIGLYLRGRNDFTVLPGSSAQSVARWMFYWILTRSLLPEGWGWFSACLGCGNKAVARLAGSVLTRVDHATRSRDRLFAWLQTRHGNDSVEEIVMAIDHMVLSLAASLDAIARAADAAEGVNYKGKPAWQDVAWLKEVRGRNEALADVFREGGKAAIARDALLIMRNQIHAESISGAIAQSAQEGEMVPPLIFTGPQAHKASRLLTRLHISNRYFPSPDGDLFIDVADCSEKLFARTIRSLNDIMRAMMLNDELLKNLRGPSGPGVDDEEFGIQMQQRVRLLSGIRPLTHSD